MEIIKKLNHDAKLENFLLINKNNFKLGFSSKIEMPQPGSEPFQLELITNKYDYNLRSLAWQFSFSIVSVLIEVEDSC